MLQVIALFYVLRHPLPDEMRLCGGVESLKIAAPHRVKEQPVDGRTQGLLFGMALRGGGGISELAVDLFRALKGAEVEHIQAALPQRLGRMMHGNAVNVDPIHKHIVGRRL